MQKCIEKMRSGASIDTSSRYLIKRESASNRQEKSNGIIKALNTFE